MAQYIVFNQDRFVGALIKQDNETVAQYLQAGIDPNTLWHEQSYVKLAVECHNVRGLSLLLQYGADPNLNHIGFTPLQIANGAMRKKGIFASYEMSEILISYGAANGGHFLNQFWGDNHLLYKRVEYIKDGIKTIDSIKDSLDSKSKLQTEDFLNKVNLPGYGELYHTLDPLYQSMVDQDISAIQEKLFANRGIIEKCYNWVKSWDPSIEPESYREVHSLLFHASNIMKSHGTLSGENSILGETNSIE